jgi:hypothetical protein
MRHQKLQLMAVGVVEVDAVWIAFATVDFDAGVFQRSLNSLVVAGDELERHVIDFAAAMDGFAVVDFEEGDALVAAFEEALPVAFVVDFHAQEVDVELSRARQIFDVENHVIDACHFEWGCHSTPPRIREKSEIRISKSETNLYSQPLAQDRLPRNQHSLRALKADASLRSA